MLRSLLVVCSALLAAPVLAAPSAYDAEVEARAHDYASRAASPTALTPLLGLIELWDEVEDRTALVKLIDQIANDPRAHRDVRSRARFYRGLMLDHAGGGAAEVRRAIGVLDAFAVAGPFDNEGKLGHATAFAPEKSWADSAKGEKAWRPLPAVSVQGLVPLGATLRPETFATGYLATVLTAKGAQKAYLSVGHQGAVKVWINGVLRIDQDRYHAIRLDQLIVPIELRAGANVLVVKVSGADAAPAVLTRVFDDRGERPPELETSADLAALQKAWVPLQPLGKGAKLPDPTPPVIVALEAAAKRGKQREQLELALAIHELALDEPERHRAESLVERTLKKGDSRAYHALYAVAAEPGTRQKALTEAVTRNGVDKPTLARWQVELGDLYAELGRDRDAEEHWRAALTAVPDFVPAVERIADSQADHQMVGVALATLAKVKSQSLAYLRWQARLQFRDGRHADAEASWQALLAQSADDVEAMRELIQIAKKRGRLADAEAILARLERIRPDVSTFVNDEVILRRAAGDLTGALARLDAALAKAPRDAALEEAAGRILLELGRADDALPRLRRALEWKPQNPELRSLIAQRDGSHAAALELQRRFAIPLDELRQRATAPAKDTDTARVVLDREVVHVLPSGLTESFTQRAVQVVDRRGAREQNAVGIRYAPSSQRFELLSARLVRRDGSITEASAVDEHEVSEPWYGLYYDVQGVRVRFDALEPGDLYVIEYTLSDTSQRNELADYFGDVHTFQEDLPRLQSDFVVIAPERRPLSVYQTSAPWLTRKDENGDKETGEHVYWWSAVNAPKLDSEPGMPGWSELAAYVHVSTYKTWAEVAQFYDTLLRGQLEPNNAIIDAVKTTIKGLKTDREKVRALYNLVVEKTRYVGLEFGIHGYQPYRVSQIFARKFGDCKDKASLLATMLRLAGVDAELVLARTRHGGLIADSPASLAIFDHAIVYVPKLDLYLDGTAEFSGSDELPDQDQDISVLRVGERQLFRTPVLPAARNRAATDWKVELAASGDATLRERFELLGQAAPEWRQHYQAKGEQHDRYERAWNNKYPGASLGALDMKLGDREQPVRIDATLELPRWARPDGKALIVRVLGRDPDMLRSYARLSTRQYDLILGYPWTQTEHLRVTLPPGYRLKDPPHPIAIQSAFGSFSLTVRPSGDALEVTAELVINRYRIARADYPAFRTFCQQIDNAISTELRLVP